MEYASSVGACLVTGSLRSSYGESESPASLNENPSREFVEFYQDSEKATDSAKNRGALVAMKKDTGHDTEGELCILSPASVDSTQWAYFYSRDSGRKDDSACQVKYQLRTVEQRVGIGLIQLRYRLPPFPLLLAKKSSFTCRHLELYLRIKGNRQSGNETS